ncbi:ribonuclease HI family protein [Methanomassiliicoccales archaeon LGM-RCC1]|nr:ribonuclease HI family protein [Methanomassiliicoccales archaeon LGM-RCC1]
MFTFYSDGGSRGNPGKSAYAIVVVEDGEVIHEHSEYLGIHTNNYAEYRGLIAGIAKVLEYKGTDAEFVMDSELVIKQMTGKYKVKNPDMKGLYEDARALCSMIPNVRFRNVRRSQELIPRADILLNEELDRHRSLDARYELRDLHQFLLSGCHVPEGD